MSTMKYKVRSGRIVYGYLCTSNFLAVYFTKILQKTFFIRIDKEIAFVNCKTQFLSLCKIQGRQIKAAFDRKKSTHISKEETYAININIYKDSIYNSNQSHCNFFLVILSTVKLSLLCIQIRSQRNIVNRKLIIVYHSKHDHIKYSNVYQNNSIATRKSISTYYVHGRQQHPC